jgi:hypothetical protein
MALMHVVAVIGAAPGVGKSTLCTALVRRLRDEGAAVDHFDEPDVLTRPEFAAAAAAFRTTESVPPAMLVDATVDYLDGAAHCGIGVVVLDALLPFVPSLLAFGHAEHDIAELIDGLAARIAYADTLVVFLDDDPDRALDRAADREGDGWIGWYGRKLARYGLVPTAPGRPDLRAYLSYERDVTRRLLDRSPWDVLVVTGALDQSPDALADAVVARLDLDARM